MGLMLSSAVGAYISGALGGLAVASDDTPGKTNFFKLGIGALAKGDTAAANKYFVGGGDEAGFGGFAGQLNAEGHDKAAIAFSAWWHQALSDAANAARDLPKSPGR